MSLLLFHSGSRRASSSSNIRTIMSFPVLSSASSSSSTPSYIQGERELRSYSTPSMSQIHFITQGRKTLSEYNSRSSRRRGYAASTAVGSSFGVVSATVASALEHAQMHSGLPWWATLGATACIIRISMLPVVSKQMKASVLIAHATSVMQGKKSVRERRFTAVSYTHLTLPTICSV